MEHRISDLMENFADDRVDLADPHITGARRMKTMTLERLGLVPEKKHKSWGRTLLMAAAAACLLAVSALAVYHISLQDRTLDRDLGEDIFGEAIVQYSAVAGPAESPETGTGTEAPLSGTAEYMAEAELLAYLESHTETMDATRLLPQDHFARLYGLGYDFFAEKLEEIAEKYDLRLLQQNAFANSLPELYELLGTDAFLAVTEEACRATVYDDGSFVANLSLLLPGGGDCNMNFYRAAKGSFTSFFLLGDAPDTYTCESYETASGQIVDLAWSDDDALLFAELDSCYITAELGYNTVGAEPVAFDMDDLKALANGIDFALLDSLDTEAIAPVVAEKYNEFWAEYRATASDPSEKAQAVLADLGNYSLAAVPAELSRYHSQIRDYADSADSLWTFLHPGGSHAEVNRAWELDGEVITNYVYFSYIRYWADEAQTASAVRENHDEVKAEREACGFAEMADLEINGCDGYYYRDTGLRSTNSLALVWVDEEANLEFRLHLPGDWSLEDAMELAESMVCLD